MGRGSGVQSSRRTAVPYRVDLDESLVLIHDTHKCLGVSASMDLVVSEADFAYVGKSVSSRLGCDGSAFRRVAATIKAATRRTPPSCRMMAGSAPAAQAPSIASK